MRGIWQDIRFGARMLAKHPGFTAIAVLTLALGIGANTAIFSLVKQVLLRRLPVQNPSELLILRAPGRTYGHTWSDGDEAQSFSFPMYKRLRETNQAFSGLLARFAIPVTIASQGPTERGGNGWEEGRDSCWAIRGGRKPGLSLAQTEAAINAAYRPLLQEQHFTIKGLNAKDRERFLSKKVLLIPGARGRTTVQTDSGQTLTALFVMVALVLLIACTNIANLLLAQGAARQRELAIRSALGASRGRMMRQLLAESLLCALGGGVLGLLLGSWLMGLLTSVVASNVMIQGLSGSLDLTVLAFAAAATLLSGVFFGLLPP